MNDNKTRRKIQFVKTVLQHIYLRNTERKFVLSHINNATYPPKPVTYKAFVLKTADVPTTL
jgi:hypothetical protein